MARINVEDGFFRDKRWLKLIIKVGCEHKALGLVCSAWILAQQNWLKHKSIPAKAWSKDFDILIECELASILSDGSFYVKGSERAFKWLEQKSNAGQKSSEKKLLSLEKARSFRWNENDSSFKISEHTLNGSERKVNGSEPLTPTLTPTQESISCCDDVEYKNKNSFKKAASAEKSSVQIFEERFSPKCQEFIEYLGNKELGRGLKKYAPEILERFGEVEYFNNFLNDLEERYKRVNPTMSLVGWADLVIKKEIGVIK